MPVKKFFHYLISAQILIIFILTGTSFGDESTQKPLWEFGLFNAAARIPHYPGSDEHRWYVLPLPYMIYRGDIIRANREGVRGIFYDSEHIETSISLYGNPPVSSSNKAREDMPDLNALFELGPAVKWFFSGRHPKDALYLSLAFRGAFSIGFDHGPDIRYEGLRTSLNLLYSNQSLFEQQGIKFGVNAGINFSNSQLHSYFYDVRHKYARPGRPHYKSGSGYSGSSLAVTLEKILSGNLSLGFYTRWDNLSGAAYDDSPLVKREHNFILGTALIWKITESKKLVDISRF